MVEPFETCSIRPPTENYSLTFRLTRNCGWNKCLFCPVYKEGVKFSKRSIDDIKRDIDRAKAIDDLISERHICDPYPGTDSYAEAEKLVEEIKAAQPSGSAGECSSAGNESDDGSRGWFSSWFKDKPTIEDSIRNIVTWRLGGGQTCFLGDSNSLVVPPRFFHEVCTCIRGAFPGLKRFTIYGRTRSAAAMSQDHLAIFADAGLDRIHFGLESGCDAVLGFMRKGVTGVQHIEGCRKTRQAGISCGVYVMPGLGGSRWSREHAIDTARVISQAEPDYVRLRTLEVFPGTPLENAMQSGIFVEATEEEVVREIRTLVEGVDAETSVVSDSASNLLDVSGRLPGERSRMLAVIDEYLELSPREKLAFSLSSRLQSFIGQYGGVTREIMTAIMPFIHDNAIDIRRSSDADIEGVIRLIRSRLMP